MNKLLSIFLALSLLFGLCAGMSVAASAEDEFSEEYFVQDNGDGTCAIAYYSSDATAITVPNTVDGMTVTALSDDCFINCEQLETVILPDSLCVIGNFAFSGCTKLKSITLPEAVTSIGWSAFENCSENGLSITLPKNVCHLGAYALSGASTIAVSSENPYFCVVDGVLFSKDQTKLIQYPSKSIASSYVIPNTVNVIGEFAFIGAEALQSVLIPDSVTEIQYGAFQEAGLTDMKLPESVKYIGGGVFYGCSRLKTISLPKEVYMMDWNVFGYCESLEEIVLPYGILKIDFEGCSSLKHLVIPSSVGYITENSFMSPLRGCNALSSIEFTGSQEQWAASDWSQEEWVSRISVQCTGTNYVDSLFRYSIDSRSGKATIYAIRTNAKSATRMEVPQTVNGSPVAVIEPEIFRKNPNIQEIVLPEGLMILEDRVFERCSALQKVSLPSTLRYIGVAAFSECTSLQDISLPEGIKRICDNTFADCNQLRQISLPDSVTEIETFAFANCTALSSLELPDNLETISSLAFHHCSKLQNIILPDSIRSIGEYAFDACTGLRWIYIPASLESAAPEIFYGNSKLDVYYEGSAAQWEAIGESESILKSSGATLYCDYKPPVGSFLDVKESDWFCSAVAYAYEHELMNGTSEKFFSPSSSLTRGQLVTILYRIAGEPETATEKSFTDVKAGRYYTDAVKWAAEKGIVNGYNDGTFKPDAPISREQVATILYRYEGAPDITGDLDFPDENLAGKYAKDALRWAMQKGLITGVKTTDGTILNPKANATRAQIATIIMRYLEAE